MSLRIFVFLIPCQITPRPLLYPQVSRTLRLHGAPLTKAKMETSGWGSVFTSLVFEHNLPGYLRDCHRNCTSACWGMDLQGDERSHLEGRWFCKEHVLGSSLDILFSCLSHSVCDPDIPSSTKEVFGLDSL